MGSTQTARVTVAAFLFLVGVGAIFLIGQWLVTKVDTGTPVDIAEWPFVAVAVVLALGPVGAAIGLVRDRPWANRLGRACAWALLLIGAVLTLYSLMLLSMGVPWTLLLGGAALVVGAAAILRALPRG